MKFLIGLAVLVVTASLAFGGTIIVSGDSSITQTAGNLQFFHNVLGTGTQVLIQVGDSGGGASNDLNNYYNGLSGVTSTRTTAADVTDFGGANLFISIMPLVAYSSGEIAAIQTLLDSGGTAFFIGESAGYSGGGVGNPLINDGLAALGVAMSLSGNDGSTYPVSATVLSNPLTAGVSSFTYGFTSFVTGGTPLFTTSREQTFVAVTGANPVPEPASLALVLGGAAVLTLIRRRRS